MISKAEHVFLHWVAGQFENLPHVKFQLRELADRLVKEVEVEAPKVEHAAAEAGEVAAKIEQEFEPAEAKE